MQQRHPIPKRATAEQLPFYRAGHSSKNIHPEDAPYITAQKNKYPNPLDVADELDYPGEPSKLPTSARRYYDTRGNQVIEQGNRRVVIHDESPRKRQHWLLYMGVGMLFMLALYLGF